MTSRQRQPDSTRTLRTKPIAAARLMVVGSAVIASGGLTAREIVNTRVVPATHDRNSAVAAYSAEPGQPFPLTVRT